MNSKQLYLRLLKYVRPYWKMLATSVTLLALHAATEPLFPMLIKPLLDEGFVNKDIEFIRWIPIFIVGLFLVRGILLFTSSYASRWLSTHIVTDIRNHTFSRLIMLPVSFFDARSSGALTSKIAYDVNNVTGAATTVLTTLVRDSLTIIALLAWLLWIDWELTLITFAITPFLIVIFRYFNIRMRRLSRDGQLSMSQLTHLIEQVSSTQKVVKIFRGHNFELKQFKKANMHQRGIDMRAGIAAFAIVPLTQIITSIAIALIISIAINDNSSSTNTAGGFMSFLTAMLLLLQPVKRLAGLTSTLQKGLAAAESVFEIIDTPAEKDNGKLNNIRINGDIQFQDVSFSYQNIIALDKINITIKSKATTAIIGRSGSGKTTLVNLIPRFYEIDSGTIMINDTPLNEFTLASLRGQISVVSQDIRLFNDTIEANVAYGDESPSTKKVLRALQKAHALKFVEKLPDKLNTLIGQDGVRLSGGERQRIAIARAFYKDSPVLILDEATSSLDSESERYVQEALNDLIKKRTTIIIAHRLSTIENADNIIIMDNGKIIDQGTNAELIKRNGQDSLYQLLQSSTAINK